jgi:hypothetical protein
LQSRNSVSRCALFYSCARALHHDGAARAHASLLPRPFGYGSSTGEFFLPSASSSSSTLHAASLLSSTSLSHSRTRSPLILLQPQITPTPKHPHHSCAFPHAPLMATLPPTTSDTLLHTPLTHPSRIDSQPEPPPAVTFLSSLLLCFSSNRTAWSNFLRLPSLPLHPLWRLSSDSLPTLDPFVSLSHWRNLSVLDAALVGRPRCRA